MKTKGQEGRANNRVVERERGIGKNLGLLNSLIYDKKLENNNKFKLYVHFMLILPWPHKLQDSCSFWAQKWRYFDIFWAQK